MTCKKYEQDLLLLAHGQLDASDTARVRQHIAACPPCNARLTQLAGVSLLLADAVHSAPSTALISSTPHSAFFPAKQQWLLSAFLGGCILFALLSLVRTAQSYAAPLPGVAHILPFASTVPPSPACDSVPPCEVQAESARLMARQKQNGAKVKSLQTAVPGSKF